MRHFHRRSHGKPAYRYKVVEWGIFQNYPKKRAFLLFCCAYDRYSNQNKLLILPPFELQPQEWYHSHREFFVYSLFVGLWRTWFLLNFLCRKEATWIKQI